MREKVQRKSAMDAASEELERRSRYLSSLIQKTKIDGEDSEKNDNIQKDERDDEVLMKKVKVRAADMAGVMQTKAFRIAGDEVKDGRKVDNKKLALALKKEFDSAYGPAWHCIVGTSFGSYVTHSVGGFLYFSIDKVYILLFRTAVEPLSRS